TWAACRSRQALHTRPRAPKSLRERHGYYRPGASGGQGRCLYRQRTRWNRRPSLPAHPGESREECLASPRRWHASRGRVFLRRESFPARAQSENSGTTHAPKGQPSPEPLKRRAVQFQFAKVASRVSIHDIAFFRVEIAYMSGGREKTQFVE